VISKNINTLKKNNMQQRHTNRKQYFEELAITSEKYFIPYISQSKKIEKGMRILEIGCGDGGNLLPFARIGCKTVGIDISEGRIHDAKLYFKEKGFNGDFITSDIFLINDMKNMFNIIICHDVMEHIHDKKQLLQKLSEFLTTDGIVFVSFPAWQMPFGGHQQLCKNRLLSHFPFLHLFPNCIYINGY
jgi:2-polyprenyl-3-methyl-5-hydroxy-6-metoxy-1,4-benzoquinol methylase